MIEFITEKKVTNFKKYPNGTIFTLETGEVFVKIGDDVVSCLMKENVQFWKNRYGDILPHSVSKPRVEVTLYPELNLNSHIRFVSYSHLKPGFCYLNNGDLILAKEGGKHIKLSIRTNQHDRQFFRIVDAGIYSPRDDGNSACFIPIFVKMLL